VSKLTEQSDNIYKCPCGSGKQPQDCCFKNGLPPNNPRFPLNNQNLIISDFSKYNQIELISALAGLQLYSKNHSCIKRLATAIQIASSISKSGAVPVSIFDLEQLFNEYFPAKCELSMSEDPPEDLLTENIEFVNGNNIVFSGIFGDGGHILRIILRSLTLNKDTRCDDFIRKIIPQSLALLLLSNEVAVRSGYDRYSLGDVQLWGDIKIPEKEEFARLQKAVIFSLDEIDKLFSPYGLDKTILDSFITRIGSSKLLKGERADNPLYVCPLVKINDTLILTIPAAIVGAIRHNILMTAKKERKIKQLTSAILDSYWLATQINLELLGFEPVDFELPPLEKTDGFLEGIYAIDTDKIAYIQLVGDNADSYQQIFPLKFWSDKKRMKIINQRYEKIISWLFSKDPDCKHIFFISIFGSLGRWVHLTYSPEQKNVRAFGLTSENFEVLARFDDCDCLKLWKFIGHFDEVCAFHKIYSTSALDRFEFYLRSHVPRDLWEGDGPAVIVLPVGTGQRLRLEAAKKTDIHAVRSGNPLGWVTVTRFSSDDISEPIYVPEGTFLHPFEHVVENYHQPIWIEAGPHSGKIFFKDYSFYYQFIDVCSFWIWKITDSLRPHLIPLGTTPIHIMIDFETFNEDGFIEYEVNEEKLRRPNVSIDKETRRISLILNGTIFNAIDENDNSGERCIVDTLLVSFGNLLEEYNLSNTLDAKTRDLLLSQYIPYGTKRKLSNLSSKSDASLDPRWLPDLRLLQDHDFKEQFNGLKKVFEEFQEQSEFPITEDNVSLLYNYCVDHYLERLKSSISEYSWTCLLSAVISQYEGLLFYLAIHRQNVPRSMYLYYDLETQVSNFLSKRELHDFSSTAMRNLIEIMSAEPPHGTNNVNKTDFDTLLALSHIFVHMGSLSNAAYYDLFKDLPEKIEGVDPESDEGDSKGAITQFFEEKVREAIEVTVEKFEALPLHEEKEKIIKDEDFAYEQQEAYRAEFGLKLTQIIRFFACVVDLGFELETSSPHLPLSEFKARVNSVLYWTDEDIDRAIQQFSLVPRPKYEIAPEAYSTKKDIFPWVYNRRISYLARPLIIGPEPKDDPLIFWGPRHSYEALRHLTMNVYSGRYRIDEKTSPEMKKLISKIQNESAKSFEKEVSGWFKHNTSWTVDHSVSIAPNGKLNAETNLGDIDVLAIDIPGKTIYSIECKMINFGRNTQEISTEIKKFLGDEGGNDAAMMKHLKRDTWLKSHVDVVCSKYNLPQGDYSVRSLFIVSEELVTAYIRETPLPIIAFSRVKREGGIK
jgi:hypothetical protein